MHAFGSCQRLISHVELGTKASRHDQRCKTTCNRHPLRKPSLDRLGGANGGGSWGLRPEKHSFRKAHYRTVISCSLIRVALLQKVEKQT